MRAAKNNMSSLISSIRASMAIGVFVVIAAAVVAIAVIPGRSSSTAALNPPPPLTVLSFSTMVGVDDAFVGRNQVRGVRGDELPWDVGTVNGSLTTDGHLQLNVTGIVFSNDPSVPPELRGINDEDNFRALLSCQTPGNGRGNVTVTNVMTQGFPATRSGNSNIDAFITLTNPCVAPIIFVMSGSENKWFAVTGSYNEVQAGD